jgi:hypothetical protein
MFDDALIESTGKDEQKGEWVTASSSIIATHCCRGREPQDIPKAAGVPATDDPLQDELTINFRLE